MDDADLIRKFVRSNLVVLDAETPLGDDDNIFDLGLVDSPFAIQLVAFIEKEFGLEVLDADLDIANFSSVTAIATFVRKKRAAASPP